MDYRDEETLRKLYVDEALEVREIADRCDCHRATISKWIKEFDLERKHWNPAWLREKYHGEGLKITELAELADVSETAIWRSMDKHGIDRRVPDLSQADGPYKDEGWLERAYITDEKSIREIAAECGVTKSTIRYWLKKHDIPLRDRSAAAEVRFRNYPELAEKLVEAGTDALKTHGVNAWEQWSEEEREAFRERLSEERTGEGNPMYGVTGEDHPHYKENPTPSGFYQSTRWRETREKALEQDDHQCQVCGVDAPLDVHHIQPVAAGGPRFDLDNLVVLCDTHHREWEGLYLRPDPR